MKFSENLDEGKGVVGTYLAEALAFTRPVPGEGAKKTSKRKGSCAGRSTEFTKGWWEAATESLQSEQLQAFRVLRREKMVAWFFCVKFLRLGEEKRRQCLGREARSMYYYHGFMHHGRSVTEHGGRPKNPQGRGGGIGERNSVACNDRDANYRAHQLKVKGNVFALPGWGFRCPQG